LSIEFIQTFLQTANVLKLIAKFNLLREDESESDEFTTKIISGNLNITKANGVRRSCDITIENVDGSFFLDPQTIWLRQKIKIYLGYDINGVEYYFPQGIFVISDISYDDSAGNKTASITAIDKFSLLDGQLSGTLQGTYLVQNGNLIKNAMRSLLTEVGDPKYPLLDIGTDTVPYDLYVEVGGTYGDVLTAMNNMISYNMYYDVNGVFRCEPETLDIQKPVLWDYTTANFQYQGGKASYPLKNAKNAVKVVGNNVNGNLATGYIENTNPESYFSVARLGGVPIIVVINDSLIPDDSYAQQRAEYELKKLMALYSEVSFYSVPIFFLDVNYIVTLTSPNLNFDRERFLINNLTIPLVPSAGMVTVNAVKASDLAFA
jgi:hypothetical protein